MDRFKQLKSVDGETVYPMLYEGTTYLPVRLLLIEQQRSCMV